MRYPAAGGLSAASVKSDLSALARQTVLILGLSVSGWAPHLDSDGRTAMACWEAISELTAI